MSKIGLVVEGGGMKCAYSAGILDKFLDDTICFDYVIGVSAGSANCASFLAGQRERNLRYYTEHLKRKEYFGFNSFLKTGDLFGLDFIYSTMTNHDGDDPLDYPKLSANPAEYEVVATNALTGVPAYFSGKQMSQDNYEIIKASCALPAACRPRFINGTPYFDGGVSDPIPVDHALRQGGCDKIVVILSKPRDFQKKPEHMRLFYSLRIMKYPKIVEALNNRHISYMQRFRRVFELEKEGRAFVFAPSRHLEMSTYAMDPEENRRLYDLGIEDYRNEKDRLGEFLTH